MKRIKNSIFLIILFICSWSNIYSQYPNFRLHPSDNHQIEPTIVRHPQNPQILFASAYTIRTSFRSEGIYVSTNGGLNWIGTDTCSGNPINNHGGDPGPVIDKDGTFLLTHQGGFVLGMYANYSTDYGHSWSNNFQIAANDQDKGSPGTDDVPTSPYYGRTYLVWTRYTTPFPIVVSYTANRGVTWVSPITINNNPGHISQGPALSVDDHGYVFATWSASIQSSPFTEDYIGVGKSTNGGVNWIVSENAFDCNGIRTSSLQPWNIRVNSFPAIDIDKSNGPRRGWIYITIAEKNLSPAGTDPDITFHRSTDNGLTWSPAVRVNNDPINNGKVQFFPAIRVDEEGGINIVYYDNRNISTDSLEVYLSRSTDGGSSWHDYRISDHHFKPKAIAGTGGGNQGDNIGITSANGLLFPVWMDDYTGVYQVWTAAIDYHSIGVKKLSNNIPKTINLYQNFPNPFNPTTKIIFDLSNNANNYELKNAGSMPVQLIIFNNLGQEVVKLVDEKMSPGSYEIEWNAINTSSGVYFYQLIVNKNIFVKKMVLLK